MTSEPASRTAARLLVGLVAAGALGALGGWLWWTWWSPGFDGTVYETTGGPRWLPKPLDPGFADAFTGTAQYVIVGFGLALLLGLVLAFQWRNRAVLGLGVALAGAAIAATVMLLVGQAPSPPDPDSLASAETVGNSYPDSLEVTGASPYLVWPVGVLFAYAAVMFTTAGALTFSHRDDAAHGRTGDTAARLSLGRPAARGDEPSEVSPGGSPPPPPPSA